MSETMKLKQAGYVGKQGFQAAEIHIHSVFPEEFILTKPHRGLL